jgi:hypothetical protein
MKMLEEMFAARIRRTPFRWAWHGLSRDHPAGCTASRNTRPCLFQEEIVLETPSRFPAMSTLFCTRCFESLRHLAIARRIPSVGFAARLSVEPLTTSW